MSAPERWGRHGDEYADAGGFNGRGQLVRLRVALGAVLTCRGTYRRDEPPCEHPLWWCCAWRVGHHAGRVFAARERAREAR